MEKNIFKSIFESEDLRCNSVGNEILFEAEDFAKSMMEKYSDYNPREIAHLASEKFYLMANRKIIEARHNKNIK